MRAAPRAVLAVGSCCRSQGVLNPSTLSLCVENAAPRGVGSRLNPRQPALLDSVSFTQETVQKCSVNCLMLPTTVCQSRGPHALRTAGAA